MTKRRYRRSKFRDVACPNARCKFFGKLGCGTVVSNGTYFVGGTRVRKFICRHCGKVFNSRARTPFRWLHTPQHKVLLALVLLVKGLSLRGTAEVLEVKLDTVRNWLRKAAQHSAAVNHILVHDLRLTQVQVDELWTFVKKTPRSHWEDNPKAPLPRKGGRGKSVGTAWIWTAVAPEYRLALAAQVGNRNLYAARFLLRSVRWCLAKNTWPLFTSGALRHYTHVLLEVFGVWQRPNPTGKQGRPRNPALVPHPLLGYAKVDKRRKGGRVVEVNRSIVFGLEKEILSRAEGLRRANGHKGKINTAYVERQNLTMREENGRLSRKTLAFSKNRLDLQRQLDFWRAYTNFVRPHRSLRVMAPNGSGPRRWLPRTPIMAAGISDHVWTLKELLKFKHWIYQPY